MNETGDWDYIIVGAGSAGCVLAERLSVNPANLVLLLEEGPEENWISRMPKGFAKTLSDPRRASYVVTSHDRGAQPKDAPELKPDIYMRGKILGGSSSLNGMVWMRGQPEDYDHYGEIGLNGWNWRDVLPYFKKLEDHELGADELRGAGGPIEIGARAPVTTLSEAVIAAGGALGLPRKADQNHRVQEGIGYLQLNIDKRGRRVSAARAFLASARKRVNLRIISGVRVDRILFKGKRAVGVEGMQNGHPVHFCGRGDVILSAGAIASPALLQRSGIGPAGLLAGLGINVVHNSPRVGANMREHWLLALQFRLDNPSDSLNRSLRGVRLAGNLLRYLVGWRGPLALGPYEVGGFMRTRSGSNRPDTQIMFMPASVDETGGGLLEREPGMQLFTYKLRPESTGSINITSPDPAAPPKIDPRYLATEEDRRDSIAATRFLRKLAATEPLSKRIKYETARTAWAQSDDEILQLYQRYGQAGYHACGTCAMGADLEAVLDDHVRVRGVENLRVVDLSMFPELVSGNTNSPVMALAWRASDIILANRRGTPN